MVPEHAIQRVAEAYRSTGRGRLLLEQLAGVERARQLAGPPRPRALGRVFPCRWEGEPTSDWNADPMLQVRRCGFDGHKYDRCRRGGSRCQRDGIESCTTCGHHAPLPPGSVRHLLYHVFPVRGNGTWQRNLDRLIPRLPLFNGRRVVAIMTREPGGMSLDPPGAVEEYLGGHGCETFTIRNVSGGPNRPRRLSREAVSLVPLLERVANHVGSVDVTFYGQTKGATRPFDPGTTVHRWANLLYELNLDYWPVVENLLQSHPIVGAFKKVGHAFRGHAYHFTGSFYWFRNRDLFGRDWRKVDHDWWGVESYPAVQFGVEEAGCVAVQGTQAKLDLYKWDYFTGYIESEVAQWRSRNSASRTGIGSSAVASRAT